MGGHFQKLSLISCEYGKWQFGDINPCKVGGQLYSQAAEADMPSLPAAASPPTCRQAKQAACRRRRKLLKRCTDDSSGHHCCGAGSCQCCCLLPARPGFLNLTGATPLPKFLIPWKICCHFRVLPPRDGLKMSGEKDELVQKAKLAEQAERYWR